MTLRQLSLARDLNYLELLVLKPLIPYVTRRAVIDSKGHLPRISAAEFIQAPSPWPFCPNRQQLTLPFWRGILTGHICAVLGLEGKIGTSWKPPVVQGIAQQESLYVASLKGTENKTRGWHDKNFWTDYKRCVRQSVARSVRDVDKTLEQVCAATKYEPSEYKTTK